MTDWQELTALLAHIRPHEVVSMQCLCVQSEQREPEQQLIQQIVQGSVQSC